MLKSRPSFIGPQSSRRLNKETQKPKLHRESVAFWDVFHIFLKHMNIVHCEILLHYSIGMNKNSCVQHQEFLLWSRRTPGTHCEVPEQSSKCFQCVPITVDLMAYKWEGLLGFLSHLQPHMAPIFPFAHTHAHI